MLLWLNEYRAVLHLGLHVLVPALVSLLLIKLHCLQGFQLKYLPSALMASRAGSIVAIFSCLMATMLVDVDHLLAVPIYAPNRCSIFFHPLHQSWAIIAYVLVLSWLLIRAWRGVILHYWHKLLGLFALGLLLHMALDAMDCIWMKASL